MLKNHHHVSDVQSSQLGPTYHLPGEGLVPEGGAFLQTEERSTNGSSESSGDPGGSARRHKVPLISERRSNGVSSRHRGHLSPDRKSVPVTAEVREVKLDALESDALKLRVSF